jgi:hypothetical protein
MKPAGITLFLMIGLDKTQYFNIYEFVVWKSLHFNFNNWLLTNQGLLIAF